MLQSQEVNHMQWLQMSSFIHNCIQSKVVFFVHQDIVQFTVFHSFFDKPWSWISVIHDYFVFLLYWLYV